MTVLADESTDIAVNKRLVLYAQISDPKSMTVSTEYITNKKITEGTGEAIAREIFQEMDKRGVPASKILGLGSDGASVMTGKNKGVTGMMLRQNPHLVNVHCIAHRLALCTSQAAENIPALKDYQESITSIYYYFKYSSGKQSRLAEIEKVLSAPQLKYKEVHSVRWLSFYDALQAVYRTLEPLLTYLADTTLKDPKAVHLKKKVACLKFISLTYIMMDIIPHVTKLSLFFQKENVDLALVQVNIDHCVKDLQKLLTDSGPHEQLLKEHLQDELYFGHEISGCPQDHVQSAKCKFIQKLVDNINDRFSGTDIMTAFGVLSMRPLSFLSSEDLDIWGNDQIEKLAAHYGFPQTHKWKDGSEEKSTTSPPLIDPEATIEEWKVMKPRVVAHMYPRDDTQKLWNLINQYSPDEYPNMIKLAHLALTCPIHTSGCERGFSIQNSILTSTRNRLTPETQDILIRIKAAGKSLSEFDFDSALELYRKQRKRKIFN